MTIENYGFDMWFRERAGEFLRKGMLPARVTAVHKGMYYIVSGEGFARAELTGRFLYTAESSEDYPTVGDWVLVQTFDEGEQAIIHALLPRKTVLKRKAPGRKDAQLLAANVDKVFIVQALDGNAGIHRLERYLVMVFEAGCEAVLLLSKTDLVSDAALNDMLHGVKAHHPALHVIAFSNLAEDGLDDVRSLLMPAKTYCVLGSSGVGKTSLINHLLGESKLNVGEVRAWDGKGRHITTSRQLIAMENGALLIDTPGMRELGVAAVEEGLASTFEDILELAQSCRFTDCSHTHEAGCAVRKAVEEGRLEQGRYEHYLQLQRESLYYTMSEVERRQRARVLGKTYKRIQQETKRRKAR